MSIPQTTAVSEPLTGGHAYLSKKPTAKVIKAIKKNPDVLQGYRIEQEKFVLKKPIVT